MIKKKKLPNDIQFSFHQLQDPAFLDIQLTLHVFIGQAFENEPVVYAVNMIFFKDDAREQYVFQSLDLDACYTIAAYDQQELERQLKKRLYEILEHCVLRVNAPMKEQLEGFLAEYGGGRRCGLCCEMAKFNLRLLPGLL